MVGCMLLLCTSQTSYSSICTTINGQTELRLARNLGIRDIAFQSILRIAIGALLACSLHQADLHANKYRSSPLVASLHRQRIPFQVRNPSWLCFGLLQTARLPDLDTAWPWYDDPHTQSPMIPKGACDAPRIFGGCQPDYKSIHRNLTVVVAN
jgi:hypothetical protein